VPKQLLLVEDDPLVALMLEDYLDACGWKVTGNAENVAVAIEKIAAFPYDAALIDIHLADGETSEEVLAALQIAGIPYIIMTGGSIKLAETLTAGAQLLLKPFTLPQLETALLRLAQ